MYTVITDDTDTKQTKSSSSAQEYVYFRKELQEQLEDINCNVSRLIKDDTQGICSRVKEMLSEMNVQQSTKDRYPMEALPVHESEGRHEEKPNNDSNEHTLDMENIDVSNEEKETPEEKIKQLVPFFTVVNVDDGDTKYKEICRNTLNRKKNVSLVALEKKIEKRNDLMNKFGKTYTITNLS